MTKEWLMMSNHDMIGKPMRVLSFMNTTQLQVFIRSRLRELDLSMQSMQDNENNSSQFSQGICYLNLIYITFHGYLSHGCLATFHLYIWT